MSVTTIFLTVLLLIAAGSANRFKPKQKGMHTNSMALRCDIQSFSNSRLADHGLQSFYEPDEQRLLHHLICGHGHAGNATLNIKPYPPRPPYNEAVRPVYNESTPVVIRMGFTLAQIFDLDEKNQVLIGSAWLDQEWDDEYLRWDPELFGGIKVVRIPAKVIWLPDLILYNNAAQYSGERIEVRAMVSHTGVVFYPVPTKIHSSCQMNLRYFPFDSQTCHMKYGSWTYDGLKVDIINRTEVPDLSNFIKNGEYEVISMTHEKHWVYYTCCIEPYTDVTFYLHIRRRTKYYYLTVFIPCSIMSILTLMVFWISPNSNEKIALGITILLAYSVFMLSIVERMPETSIRVPLMSVYLCFVLSMTSLSVLTTVFILNLYHVSSRRPHVPQFVRYLFFQILAPVCFLKRRSKNNLVKGGGTKEFELKVQLADFVHKLKEEFCEMTKIQRNRTVTEKYGKYATVVHYANFNARQNEDEEDEEVPLLIERLTPENDELREAIHRVAERYLASHDMQVAAREWVEVAAILDRVFFIAFFITTIVATVIILVVIPESQHIETYQTSPTGTIINMTDEGIRL